MRNLSFRGYAQGKGFDPLKVPDETWKLQDETERTLRGMREVRSQNLQNRNDQLETLKSNARKEEIQRDRNFSLDQEFKKAYHDAEMQHYKTRILDQDTKIREAKLDAQRFEKLKDLAPKAFMAIADFQNQRFEAIMGKARSIDRRLEEQLGTEQYDLVLDEVKKGRTLKEVMRERHPSYKDTIDDSLNAWEMIAVQRHMVRNNFNSTIYGDLASHKENFTRNDTTYNKEKLNDKLTDATTSIAILDSFYEGKMDQLQQAGFSPSFLNKELRPMLDKVIGQEKKELFERVAKNKEAQVYETRGIEIIELWREGPQDIMNGVAAVSDKKRSLDEDFHYAEHYARTDDEYGMAFWTEKFNEPVIIKGKETTIAQEFPNRVAAVYKKANERYEEAEKQHENYLNQNIDQALTVIQNTEEKQGYAQHPSLYKKVVDNLLNGENVTMADLEKSAKGRALIDGMNRPLEEYDNQKWDAWAAQVEDERGVFTVADIMSPQISAAQRKRLFSKTLEGRGLSGEFDKTIGTALKKQMKFLAGSKTENDIHAPQIDLLLPHAKKDFYKHLFKYFDENNAENIQDKDSLANAALSDYISSMDKNSGLYRSEGLGKNFKYTFFDTMSEELAMIGTITAVADNPSLLSETDSLTDAQDLQIINYGKNGGSMPRILEELNTKLPNLDPIAIVNMRLKANGEKEIERKGLDNLFTAVDSEYRHLMTNMPSMSKTFRALELTMEKSGDMSEGNTAMYEALISKDIGSAFNEPYEVIRTPNGLKEASEMGVLLDTTTVEQSMNMLNSGMASSIGAFDLNLASFQRAQAAGIISNESTLNAATQLEIFRYEKQLDTSTFIIDGMDEPLPGLGQYYTFPFNYKQRKKTRGRGISQKQANERFNKNIKNLVKFVDKGLDAQLEEGRQLSLQQEFLFDKIKQSIQANKAKVDSGELQQTSRGLRPTETTKVVEETKSNIFAADFALKGFNYYQFTDDMRRELESD